MFKRLLMALAIVLFVAGASAQVTTSRLGGLVKSATGDLLTGATIKATHQPTGSVYSTITRSNGTYDILNMNPGGPYVVEISYVGYGTSSQSNIFLALGDEYRHDATLSQGGEQLTEVVVTAAAARNRGVKSGAATNIDKTQISTLPTISRSINDFTRLTPQANGNGFNGRDNRFNNITIDGANFNNNFGISSSNLPGGDAQPISLDAIEELSVNISPFDVKQGNFTGAGISAITRGGTNKFEGSVYGFYRDQSFNGKKVGDKEIGNLSKSTKKIYGARLGGPFIKNKLFFFINGEIEKTSSPGITWKASRGGSSSDPNVSRTLASDLDLLSDFLRTNYDYETGPYENLPNFSSENYKILGRLDWNISNSHRLTLRYNMVNATNDQETNGTSAPNPRSSSNRWSKNSMGYQNANYGFEDIVSSFTFDFKSKFNNRLNNQFLATFTDIQTNRTSGSSPFPFVDIQKDGDAYISFGYELFSWNNKVKNKVYTFTDNLNYIAGKHNLTLGGAFDYLYFGNSFMRYGTSYYRYSSLDDFINGAAPNAYALTYGYNGNTKPIADLEFGQLALYLQDEIRINSQFKLLIGLRTDRAIYLADPAGNSAISAKTFKGPDGQAYKFDMGSWPKSKFMWSPRIGFNWDVEGNRNLIVRGGTGIFTGRLPFVWYTNQPTNSYGIQATVERTGSAASEFLFDPNPHAYVNEFPQDASTLPNGASLAIVDKDFVFPQVWRTSIGFDKRLPWDLLWTVEAIYTKDVNAVRQYNGNLAEPNGTFNGPDKRPRYTSSAARSVDASVREAMILTNTNKGSGISFSTQLSRNFKKGFYGQISYSYNMTLDLSGNPGSQAASAWSNINSVRNSNNLDLAVSQYSIPHRIAAAFSYRFDYAKHFGTTVSLFYEGRNQGRMTFKYSNDMNNDGLTNDLLYIPASREEAGTLIPNTADADAFWAFLEQDKYLSRNKGNYAENNGGLGPWTNIIDLRILQDFYVKTGSQKHTLQLSLDMLNFTNFLNKSWGATYREVVSNGGILRWASNTAGGVPQFTMNKVSGNYPTKTFERNVGLSSTWGMQLGLRYIF